VVEGVKKVERVKGIEPSYAAWEAAVLPLNYTRNCKKPTRPSLSGNPGSQPAPEKTVFQH
jgi:hypothetical protein